MPERVNDYAEMILNVVMDSIKDIILIHDPDHTVVWMNRAGLQAWKTNIDDVVGKRCYELFGYDKQCDDCMTKIAIERRVQERSERFLPETGIRYECTSIPIFDEKGRVVLVVQHLHLPNPTYE